MYIINNNKKENNTSFHAPWRSVHLAPWTPLGMGLGDDFPKKLFTLHKPVQATKAV